MTNNFDKKILKVLENRGIDNSKKIEEYFFPSISFLIDPFKLSGIEASKQRIEKAILNKENIVIYGDYDADGVCASSILYKYFKEKGIIPNVFIPNRFEDGYGLNKDTIEYIAQNLYPDLLITVDCGITAVEEINLLNDLGIDVIVTDHHLPGDNLPKSIAIIDPKLDNLEEVYNLCGAGVALKLIQALGGNIEKYVDLAAIATIGDIVPLIYENRLISYLGLQKINTNNTNLGIKYLLNNLNIKEKLTSQDVAFKIVPRLNSAGRIKDAKIAFNLLIEEDEISAKKYANELEILNTERINIISEAYSNILEKIKDIDINKSNAIVVCSSDYNLGIIGILASKLVSEYKIPSFVFTETENGFIKGSCRSPEWLDIHSILLQLKPICEKVGGHKQAGGITLKSQNYSVFKEQLEQLLNKIKIPHNEYLPQYDIEVLDKDITISLAEQVMLMEPTGCGNEKIVFKMPAVGCEFKQTSNPNHYQIITQNKKYLVCFGGNKFETDFYSNNAQIYFNLFCDEFNNTKRPRGLVKTIIAETIQKQHENVVINQLEFLFNTYKNKPNSILYKNIENLFFGLQPALNKSGTLLVAYSKEIADFAKSKLSLNLYTQIPSNQESCILYCPKGFVFKQNIDRYKCVVLLDGILSNTSFDGIKTISYLKNSKDLSIDRSIFAECYKCFKHKLVNKKTNNIFDYIYLMKKKLNLKEEQIAFCLFVFAELGFFEIYDSNNDVLVKEKILSKKQSLESSKIYCLIKNGIKT